MGQTQHPFLTLLEQHTGAINRICRSFCHGNEEDYEDLRQEVVMNLWQGWQNYRPDYKAVTWVWHITTNTGISWLRQKKRKPEMVPIETLQLPDADPQETEILRALIQQLPRSDQQLLQFYLDGWNHTEIASMLHISQTNVQTRLYRIRIKLKDLSHENH